MLNTMVFNKKNLFIFIIAIICGVVFFTFNYNFKEKRQVYNMNVSESISLSSFFDEEDVKWESHSNSVLINDGLVIAKSYGKAHVIAKDKNDNEVYNMDINVLKNDDMSVDSHSVDLKLNQSKKIYINDNKTKEIDVESKVSKIYSAFSIEEKELFEDNKNIKSVLINEEEFDDDDINYEYDSSDESVVVVDDDGNMEAVSSGSAIVTINDDAGNEDYVHVNVEDEDIDLYTTNYNLNVNEMVQVEYNLNTVVYNENDIKWSSEDSSIAVVNDKGVITAVNSGSTNIVISVGDSIYKKVLVNVLENSILPETLDLSLDNVELKVGDYVVVNSFVYPYSASNKEVMWVSDNNAIASVNDGIISAKGVGEAIISATTVNGIRREIKVVISNRDKQVDSVNFSKHDIDMSVGDVTKVKYDIFPTDALDKNVKYYYDKNYIEVDNNSNIKALKTGNTVLTIVSSNGKMDMMVININENKVLNKSINLDKNNIEMNIGDINKLNAIVKNSFDTDVLVWSSSDDRVVKVDNDGNIRAVGLGNAIVSVFLKSDKSVVANCYIKVKNNDIYASSIKLSNNSLNLTVGDSKVITSTVIPENSTKRDVRWESSNEKVATVDNNGNVKAVGVGSAIIRVILNVNNNIYNECLVNVKAKDIEISKIVINKSSLKLIVGDTSSLSATITPSNATKRDIKWESSNEKVATVDNNGNVKAVGVGSATVLVISSTNSNILTKCSITVVKKETNKEKFINSLELMSKQVKKDKKAGKGWKYGGTRRGTFENARKKGRTIDCALYVSYALVDTGIINSKSRFYKKSSNTIHYDGSAKSGMQKHLKYINGNGKKASTLIKNGKLQKGDIVLWYNKQHTNVYAGGSKWYDAGRWTANGSSGGGKFKTLGPISISKLNNEWRVWRILRFKD